MFRDWLRATGKTIGHLAEARRRRARIVFLDQHYSHHGAKSGYRISSGIGPEIPRGDHLFPYPVRKYLSRRLKDDKWEARLILHATLWVGDASVMHVGDGDYMDIWSYRTRPRWLKSKITATFHQPPDRLQEITAALGPGMLDGIVCVSRAQLPLLKHLVPNGRCVFIPHGVDTDFFTAFPPAVETPNPLLLAVGTHRRDFTTLMAAARIIKRKRPDARIRLIGPRDAIAPVTTDGVVETMSDVSDEELRAAYRESRMLLLPLEAATANNALLESMATGRPAVISDLPAIREYTNADAAMICRRGDPQAHADAALALLEDTSRCERMGQAARTRALELSWGKVRGYLEMYLNGVADGSISQDMEECRQ